MSEPMSREQRLEEAHHETFTCGLCGGVFDKGWSDEEAEAEKQEHWPRAVAHEEVFAVVCDDCHRAMGADVADNRKAHEGTTK